MEDFRSTPEQPRNPNIHERGGLPADYWNMITRRLKDHLGWERPSREDHQILNYAAYSQQTDDHDYASREYLHWEHWKEIQRLFHNNLVIEAPVEARKLRKLFAKPDVNTVRNNIVVYAAFEAKKTSFDYDEVLASARSSLAEVSDRSLTWNREEGMWDVTVRTYHPAGTAYMQLPLGPDFPDVWGDVATAAYWGDPESGEFTEQDASRIRAAWLIPSVDSPDAIHTPPEMLDALFLQMSARMPETVLEEFMRSKYRQYRDYDYLDISYYPENLGSIGLEGLQEMWARQSGTDKKFPKKITEQVFEYLQEAYIHHFGTAKEFPDKYIFPHAGHIPAAYHGSIHFSNLPVELLPPVKPVPIEP